MNFQSATEELKKGMNGTKKVDHNTYIRSIDDGIALKLHNTDIVIFKKDGTYQLNTGGWQTVTTKDRLNKFTPARISSKKGIWYINEIPFVDGIVIDANGSPINAVNNSDQVQKVKSDLDKKVKKYIDGFAAHVIENGLEDPSAGDCWGCHLVSDSKDHPMGIDHLLSHFEEEYYVPSLLWRAIISRNYGNPPFIWAMIKNDGASGGSDMLKEILRAYFKKQKPALMKILLSN
jgi:hypothetical protein